MSCNVNVRVSADFNAPNEEACFQFMDEAIMNSGVNLIDTAEQYPIPSGGSRLRNAREGDTEIVIGKWIKDRKIARDKVVIATKITGGRNVNAQNIIKDCEGSLKRLGTDYIDVYQVRVLKLYSLILMQMRPEYFLTCCLFSFTGHRDIRLKVTGDSLYNIALKQREIPIGGWQVDPCHSLIYVSPWKT
jgi:hypothetical protein